MILLFARTKGCPTPFNWSIIIIKLYYFIPPYKCKMQVRFILEYRLFTIVRYNYRDYYRQETRDKARLD